MGSSVDWTRLRKVSGTLKICQQKLLKLKNNEKGNEKQNETKTGTEHPKTVQQFQRYNRSVVEIPEEEENKGTEEISKVIMTENFPK